MDVHKEWILIMDNRVGYSFDHKQGLCKGPLDQGTEVIKMLNNGVICTNTDILLIK